MYNQTLNPFAPANKKVVLRRDQILGGSPEWNSTEITTVEAGSGLDFQTTKSSIIFKLFKATVAGIEPVQEAFDAKKEEGDAEFRFTQERYQAQRQEAARVASVEQAQVAQTIDRISGGKMSFVEVVAQENSNLTVGSSIDMSKAAKKVRVFSALDAWRKRREQIKAAEEQKESQEVTAKSGSAQEATMESGTGVLANGKKAVIGGVNAGG